MLQLFVYRNPDPMLQDYSNQTLKSWEGEELEGRRVKFNASWLNSRKGIAILFSDSAWLLSSHGIDPIVSIRKTRSNQSHWYQWGLQESPLR